MTIEIQKQNFYFGMWRADMGNGDFLACMWQEPDGMLRLTYRFRYYVDDKVFDSNDRKSWYEMKAGPGSSPDDLLATVHGIMQLGQNTGMFLSGHFLECNGDGDAMAELLDNAERPGLHKKMLEPGDEDL